MTICSACWRRSDFDPSEDHLWCPGDLVNRGGKSLKTLRLLESLGDRFTATLGNHDLYLLRENWKYPDAGCPNRELDKILRSPHRERLIGWLQQKPLAHWSEEHRVLMVHAGVIPQWTVQDTLDHAGEVERKLRSEKAGKFFGRMGKNRVRRWDDRLSGWKRRSLVSDILTRLRFCDKNGKILSSASGPPGSAEKTLQTLVQTQKSPDPGHHRSFSVTGPAWDCSPERT